MASLAAVAAKKYIAGQAKSYEPPDPYYEIVTDERGRQKRVKRDIPPGLTKAEGKVLRKIRRRAHYLDKGVNLCGFRVGWTFFIGIIPMVGDITDAALNYTLVVKPARKLDLPNALVSHMLFNNAVSAGIGLVPVLGDIALAAWKANWRNANALEAYLIKRGQENLARMAAGGDLNAQATNAGMADPGQAPLAAELLSNRHVQNIPAHEAAAPINKKKGYGSVQ